MTHSELMTVLHRQGFDSLSEVERCVLEPGGTFYIQRKLPATDQVQYEEIMRALSDIKARLEMGGVASGRA
jgi:hypothetical protein